MIKKRLKVYSLASSTTVASSSSTLSNTKQPNTMSTSIQSIWLDYAKANQKDHAVWVSHLNLLIAQVNKLKQEVKKRLKVVVVLLIKSFYKLFKIFFLYLNL